MAQSLKPTATQTFDADLVMEHSSANSRSLGRHTSTMTLYLRDDNTGLIEWDIPALDRVEHIGLWFDGKTLDDFDGLFSLPREAGRLLTNLGYRVPDDCFGLV